MSSNSASGSTIDFDSCLRLLGGRIEANKTLKTRPLPGTTATRQRGAAQVVALQPDPALLAVGRAVLRPDGAGL